MARAAGPLVLTVHEDPHLLDPRDRHTAAQALAALCATGTTVVLAGFHPEEITAVGQTALIVCSLTGPHPAIAQEVAR
jgi:hypothetical protein